MTDVRKRLEERYFPDGEFDWMKAGADTLPVIRAGAGQYFKHYVRHNSKENRSKKHAAAFTGIALTDFFDGLLSRKSKSGPDWLGGKLDQYADKALVLPIIHELAKNGEISEWHWQIAKARDVGVSVVREAASLYGIDGYARNLGKIKAWVQMAACASALMPEEKCSRDFTEQMFTASSALTLASGIDQVQDLAHEAFTIISSNEILAGVVSLDDYRDELIAA